MKTYTVFANQEGRVEAIKVGWSWPAFCFTVIWSLFKKLWFVSAVLFVFILISALVQGDVANNSGSGRLSASEYGEMIRIGFAILSAAVSIIFGVFGNSWRERRLLSLGYDRQDTVSASNPKVAIAIWMKETYEVGRPIVRAPHIAQATI